MFLIHSNRSCPYAIDINRGAVTARVTNYVNFQINWEYKLIFMKNLCSTGAARPLAAKAFPSVFFILLDICVINNILAGLGLCGNKSVNIHRVVFNNGEALTNQFVRHCYNGKLAGLAFFPFGREVVYGGGGVSFIANVFWILFSGLELALGYLVLGCLWCITIIGIPFGRQCFKMARLALMPFGASVQ